MTTVNQRHQPRISEAGTGGAGVADGADITTEPAGRGASTKSPTAASQVVFANLVGLAQHSLPALVDSACGGIIERVPVYRGGKIISMPDLRRFIEHNLRFLLAALAEPERPVGLAIPQQTGRHRAQQGVPLPEVLQAYRITFATLWGFLVEQAHKSRNPAAPSALLATASAMWELADEHAVAVTEGYRAATSDLLLADQQRRAALVDVLLSGRPSSEANPWDAASLLGFPADNELVVIAAETPELAEASLPAVEARLKELGLASGWRLSSTLQVGVVSLQPSQAESLLAALCPLSRARTGLSPLFASPSDAPRYFRLARAALTAMPRDSIGVRMFSSSPLASLLVLDAGEARRLADQVLGGVLGLAPDEQLTLLNTLTCYIDAKGSASQAARILGCHANTVRNRLHRIQELTGRSLAEPEALSELVAAAYAVQLAHHESLAPGTTDAVAGHNPA